MQGVHSGEEDLVAAPETVSALLSAYGFLLIVQPVFPIDQLVSAAHSRLPVTILTEEH